MIEPLSNVDLANARIVVAGIPRAGKTTLSRLISHDTLDANRLLHTDDLIETHDWSEASAEVVKWLDKPGPWIIEGVACGRALRKWLAANETGKPCDVVFFCSRTWGEIDKGQMTMAKGCVTVFSEIYEALEARGVAFIGNGEIVQLDRDGAVS